MFYTTDAQFGTVKGASVPNGGDFLALVGTRYAYETEADAEGNIVENMNGAYEIDPKTGLYKIYTANSNEQIGNREPRFLGGFNNTFSFYNFTINVLFDFRFGPLPWRTLRFELERRAVADAQGTSVVNYVDADVPYTRQHEYKHFHPEWRDVMARGETVLCREYPKAWEPGDEPYYPISSPESQALLERYRTETAGVPNLIVGGRLGGYRYLDMDKSVADALAVAGAWLEKQERISNGSDKGQADG